ncbi:uncharacterized protein BX664DRAFT_331893 [Halteromyces radiatus]|uniref:uncharacterized protein n=1 Tax=Halteromyces radiatus TaxID=101107 RepID=UPI002220805B|nr:uncharacterized protein BX664DRAFT_331893 [Halteromyces radiatus]KAI8088977.1 hypothetical protein BX664DRAFT_331893 [Halteromyces radiatus]
MNAIDFLSSDIEFPCDSNEPKLSASPCTKLPEPVDWAFHDYYSTVLEKAFTPINGITDITHLEPVRNEVAPPNYLKDWKHPSVFTVEDKQDDQAVVVVLTNTIQPPPQPQPQNTLRAALRGALDLVEIDMQRNMHDSLLSPSAPRRGDPFDKDYFLSWKDDLLAETLHIGELDQDLWDDDDDDVLNMGPASPAYDTINECPILDSSLPSRISSIMPLSTSPPMATNNTTITTTTVKNNTIDSQQLSQPSSPIPQQTENTRSPVMMINESTSTSSSSSSSTSSVKKSTTKNSKARTWNVWHKVKQVTQPLSKQLKSSSSTKNILKRLFQH